MLLTATPDTLRPTATPAATDGPSVSVTLTAEAQETVAAGNGVEPSPSPIPVNPAVTAQAAADQACSVASIVKGSATFRGGVLPFLGTRLNPNGSTDIEEGQGAGAQCLTCHPPDGAPGAKAYKILGTWVPNQQFILFVAEAPSHPRISKSAGKISPEIQNGYWGNLWAMTPDGSSWYQLTHYSTTTDHAGFGVLAPIASSDKVVWAKLESPAAGPAVMGTWRLYEADLVVSGGIPSLQNIRDISTPKTTVYEPQDFSPDGSKFLVSQDTNLRNPYGWDTYEYDTATGTSVNLNQTPDQWDEHARFSPDRQKIVWASSSPYPSTVRQVSYNQYVSRDLREDFWIMDADGGNKRQLTFFNTPGHAEYGRRREIANVPTWSADGTQITAGAVPDGPWVVTFAGSCGRQ